MRYSQAISILQLTGLSPEQLAPLIGISNMTYRRWLKQRRSDDSELPRLHDLGVRDAIAVLQKRGLLSETVVDPADPTIPELVGETIEKALKKSRDQLQDFESAVFDTLNIIGSRPDSYSKIASCRSSLEDFIGKSPFMGSTIDFLLHAAESKEFSRLIKTIACGALVYLLVPMDLMPDFTIGIGYVDDYGIIALAAAFCKKHSEKPAL